MHGLVVGHGVGFGVGSGFGVGASVPSSIIRMGTSTSVSNLVGKLKKKSFCGGVGGGVTRVSATFSQTDFLQFTPTMVLKYYLLANHHIMPHPLCFGL